jgi:peptidyl-prolyl cis-trans isomerase C
LSPQTFMKLKTLSITFALTCLLVPDIASAQNQPLVVWSNGTISAEEMKGDLLRLPKAEREPLISNPQAMSQLMDNIHIYKELAHKAKASGFLEDPTVTKALELARLRALGTYYLSDTLDRERSKLGDLSGAARERYLVNKDKYLQPEKISASHILLATKDKTAEELEKKAREIIMRITGGEDFGKLAQEFSDDTGSKKAGGSLGEFARGTMVVPFEDAAFALKTVGEISQPVKTQFGVHIIKLNKKTSAGLRSFDEVKSEIINELTEAAIGRFRESLISEIRNDKSIKINDVEFEKLTGAKRIK